MGWLELVDEVWSLPKESQATLTVGDGTSPVPDFDSFCFQTRLVLIIDVSCEILAVIFLQVGSKTGQTSAITCLGEFTLQGLTLLFRDYATMVALSPFRSNKQLTSPELGMVAASSSNAVSQTTMASYPSHPAGTNLGVPSTWPTLSAPTLRSKLKIESVLWTIKSSSTMLDGKYLGLVANVEVSKGLCPKPWSTLAEAYSTALSQDVTAQEAKEAAYAGLIMPLYNIFRKDFREALSVDSGARGVFTVMDGATIKEGLPQLSNSSSSTGT
ncbi:uncharacterized protein LY79DRAFT_585293 [Colletotrichum navitas]|uniref:Uncharacterized protein n=1 Tax=Colletotrichum navitas TaxID=681940 RepID=A0AAD8PJ33_9PEZI|nr:uncharacterized protein LY79DRAFT_585293 [Colletotrichum navitas]KAK1564157.1 hypothetical protein LY79DRAFT_585293 [Colletotrichum navitas]